MQRGVVGGRAAQVLTSGRAAAAAAAAAGSRQGVFFSDRDFRPPYTTTRSKQGGSARTPPSGLAALGSGLLRPARLVVHAAGDFSIYAHHKML